LLPAAISLRLEAWDVDDTAAQITLHALSMSPTGSCPVCAKVTQRVHSRYKRTLADLPWGAWRITWQLHVQKFFCDNEACHRQIFTERLTALAVVLGGAAGDWRRRQPVGRARSGRPR
jgi:transposase